MDALEDNVFRGRRVLVTGGAGMIGSHLVGRLVKLGADVAVADNLWRGVTSNLYVDGKPLIDMDSEFNEVDLRDYQNCMEVIRGAEIVYHLAEVVAGIDYVFGNQFSLFISNIATDTNVLRACIHAGVDAYIYAGTACSFPAEKQAVLNPPPLREEDTYPANPESAYGWSKLMGEYMAELAAAEDLISVGILRLHNVYGPNSDLSPDRSQVIPALIRKAIMFPHEPFVVWGSGNQRRAFLYVDDVVDALLTTFPSGMGHGVIQIGEEFSTSIREVAEKIISISGKRIFIDFDKSKREGDLDRYADMSKAREFLGFELSTSLDEGLRETYAWAERRLRNRVR